MLAFVGIFVAGAVTGTFWGVPVIRYFSPRPPPPEQFAQRIMNDLTAGLALTPDQCAKIAPIVQQTAEDVRKARREAYKATSGIIDAMYVSIAKDLTADQRLRLQEMQAKDKARHSQWLNNRPKPPHGDAPPHQGPPRPDLPAPASAAPSTQPGPAPAQ